MYDGNGLPKENITQETINSVYVKACQICDEIESILNRSKIFPSEHHRKADLVHLTQLLHMMAIEDYWDANQKSKLLSVLDLAQNNL